MSVNPWVNPRYVFCFNPFYKRDISHGMADGVPTVGATLNPAAATFEPAIKVADPDPVAAVTERLITTAITATNPDPAAPPPGPVVTGPVVIRLNGTHEKATWEQLGVDAERIKTLLALVPPWKNPTPVQAKTIPSLLQGHDYIVQAPAGQGKTGAFLITALALLARNPGPGPHVVVVTPGMELVEQLKRDIGNLDPAGRFPLCRIKQGENDQDEATRSPNGYAGYPILAASIGRLANMVNGAEGKRGLLKNVKLFVADEADKLLRNHTIEFNRIVARLPSECQRTFWSATIDDRTDSALQVMTRTPGSTRSERLDPSELLTDNCANYVVGVPSDDAKAKYKVMELIEKFATFQQMLVFANKPKDAEFIAGKLKASGWSVDSMHGRNDGHERDRIIKSFRNKEVSVLIATDILSRGLDCPDLNCVVNWGMPRLSLPHLLPSRFACA
jgi:ATP-dependent RNA helicase RhlE